MRKLLLASLMVAVLAFGVAAATTDSDTHSFSVDIEEMAVLDCTDAPGTLSLTQPAAGGAEPAPVTDATAYIQYTIVLGSEITKEIQARISDGTLPVGCTLTLSANAALYEGTDTVEPITLSGTALDLITLIPTCATGTVADTDGAVLTYSLSVEALTGTAADSTVVKNTSNQITIEFTLADTA